MRCRTIVLHDHPDTRIAPEILDIPFRLESQIAQIRQQQERTIVVCAETCAVEFPEEDVGVVHCGGDLEGADCGWSGGR